MTDDLLPGLLARMKPRWWRRLSLIHADKTFLDRWGIDLGPVGVYVHHIAGPDPGLDLHDHPWPFVSLILRGGYSEQVADTREPWLWRRRRWERWSVHRMPFTVCHRIFDADPGTWTLIVRGPKSRTWGFYLSDEPRWVPWDQYDYATRRPNHVASNKPEERMVKVLSSDDPECSGRGFCASCSGDRSTS